MGGMRSWAWHGGWRVSTSVESVTEEGTKVGFNRVDLEKLAAWLAEEAG